jgi:carboxylesterase type B
LSLNIWTPYLPSSRNSQGKEAETKKKGKAVMVWIHGGGYSNGQGSDTTFDGGNLASRGDVVVITLNYRLSTLGFLALSNTPLKGNYGIADPITALDWIRAHVEDFGGDKDRITVFGQSAGSASVRALLASEKASGKFAGAIMQSNPGGLQYVEPFSKYMSIGEATERAKALMNETGCQRGEADVQLACLRAQDASKLVGATAVR